MVPYGPIWYRMVPYGPVWSLMVPYVRRMDPCGDPEFELHNYIDYARQSCFSALVADKVST